MRRSHFIFVALLIGFVQTTASDVRLHAQAVHICCTAEDCKNRHVKPNLRLVSPTHLSGVLADASGAPFKRSKVELRRWISTTDQVSLKVVETDDNGRFDIGKIEAGQYRFLPSATGGFKQPDSLSCPQAECRVALVLQVNPTDIPESVCPIR
jgi:5-hydroxyisourate hydrolase-like protein (transthyretin family)